MSTATQEAIIESVYDGDDAALYALADHYEEEGDPARAEFVRVQGQLHGRMITHHQEMSLAQRQESLLTEHRDRWLARLPRLPGIEYEFARGLPRAVAEDGNALRRGIEELAMCADVRAVRLKRVSSVDALVRCRALSHFRSFSLERTRLNTRTLSLLADCPHLAPLTDLCLSGVRLALDDFVAIRQAACRQNLTRLDLSRAVSEENATCAMSLTNDLPHLRDLDVTASDIPEWGLRYLWKPEGSPGLTRLRLRACGILDPWIYHLESSGHASSLTALDLSDNPGITSDGALHIAESQQLSGLRRLNLVGCQVGQYAWRRLRDRFGDGLVIL